MDGTGGVAREWQSTGHTVHIEPALASRIPDFDPRSGDHFWVIATIYNVNPANFSDPEATPMLDRENLVSIAGVFCYHCEERHTQRLGNRRCSGPPREAFKMNLGNSNHGPQRRRR